MKETTYYLVEPKGGKCLALFVDGLENPEKQSNGEVWCFLIKMYVDYNLYVG